MNTDTTLPTPLTLKAAKILIAKIQSDLAARDKQLEAATTHVREITDALTECHTAKNIADSVIVDQHGHIQQLQQLLMRYLS